MIRGEVRGYLLRPDYKGQKEINCMHVFTGTFSPKKSSKIKYCPNVKGGFSASSFKDYKLPTSIVNAIVGASNKSLALNTWTNYKTTENHLRRCEIETGVKMRFPLTDREMYIESELKS